MTSQPSHRPRAARRRGRDQRRAAAVRRRDRASRATPASRSTGGSRRTATWTWSRPWSSSTARARPPSTRPTPRWCAAWTRACRCWSDVAPAGTLVPGLSGQMLLHCGPTIEWADGLRSAAPLDARRHRGRGVGRVRRAGRPAPRRRRGAAPAGVPARHRDADGERDRPVGAGVRGRQPGRRHPRLRPDQPGPGGDRLVRPGHAGGDRPAGVPARRRRADAAPRPGLVRARSTCSPWPRRGCRSATTCTCAPRAPPAC